MTDGLQLPLVGVVTRQRADARRNRLRVLQAAQAVLTREGPDGFTMDAVATEAGVGKGTVFRRFTDRAGLAEALIDEPMRDFQDRLIRGAPPLGPGTPPAERLEAFLAGLAVFMAEHLDAVLLATTAPAYRQSAAHGFLVVQAELLIGAVAPSADAPPLARMLLGAVSAPVIAEAVAAGATTATVERAARALARSVTAEQA